MFLWRNKKNIVFSGRKKALTGTLDMFFQYCFRLDISNSLVSLGNEAASSHTFT